MRRRITSAGPSITNAEIDLVSEAIKEGWGEKMNWYIDQFTKEFSAYVGVQYCLPVAHCTDAIHLAMLALELGPGDEVIVPDLTWVASVSPLLYVGATPVFADIDPDSLCLSAASLEKCITPKTKAVVVVDLLGNMPEWNEILAICKKRGIRIIEDAAESVGATYEGKKAGTFGEISLFSFNATKLIMSGQGGALCTNDPELYRKAKLHSHHGIDKTQNGKYYWSSVLGYNYNWTNIQAALALAQLRRIEDLISYKKWLYKEYAMYLTGVEGITLCGAKQNVDATYWINTVIVDAELGLDKETLATEFSKYQIDMRPLFYPVSAMPPFIKFIGGKDMAQVNPVSYGQSKFGICLPNGNNLSADDVKYVCESFMSILKDKR
jgi:perosamine synthetase